MVGSEKDYYNRSGEKVIRPETTARGGRRRDALAFDLEGRVNILELAGINEFKPPCARVGCGKKGGVAVAF